MRYLLTLCAALLLAVPAAAQQTEFARLVARLSEGPGFFDSDNLVSNETSYLHVVGDLRRAGVRGGAYLGVGPEQNFSYIAAIQPDIAILVDIRRENMLLHLLFKAMFESAATRAEYLGLLYGRPAPDNPGSWRARDLMTLLDYIIVTPFDSARHRRNHDALMERVQGYGVPLSEQDVATLRRFHDEFALAGLQLTFSSRGRIARRNYPTAYRLYMETDLDSSRVSYLAAEDRWLAVRRLHQTNKIVPVVGDLAGAAAMPAIAQYLRETNRRISAFYVSNVEMYLFRNGVFPSFVRNVRALPAGPNSVLIRSWFARFDMEPGLLPGHFSAQQMQPFSEFLRRTEQPDSVQYWQLRE